MDKEPKKQCPACFNFISERAEICPSCGANIFGWDPTRQFEPIKEEPVIVRETSYRQPRISDFLWPLFLMAWAFVMGWWANDYFKVKEKGYEQPVKTTEPEDMSGLEINKTVTYEPHQDTLSKRQIPKKTIQLDIDIKKMEMADVRHELKIWERSQKIKSSSRGLERAAASGNLRIVKLYIKRKTPLNTLSSRRETPLSLAAQNGHLEVVRALVQAGAKPQLETRFPNEGNVYVGVALYNAAQNNHAAIVDLLLESGAPVNTRKQSAPHSGDGQSPIEIANAKGHRRIIKTLLYWGAEPEEGDLLDLSKSLEKNPEKRGMIFKKE